MVESNLITKKVWFSSSHDVFGHIILDCYAMSGNRYTKRGDLIEETEYKKCILCWGDMYLK